MQIEFDLVSLTLGAIACVLYGVLKRPFKLRSAKKVGKGEEPMANEPESEACEVDDSDQEEPVPEPLPELTPKIAFKSAARQEQRAAKSIVALLVKVLMGAISILVSVDIVARYISSMVNHDLLNEPYTSVTKCTEFMWSVKEDVSTNASAEPERMEKMPSAKEDEAVLNIDTSSYGGDHSLTVKLTRQVVGEDGKEDFVRSAYYGTLMVGSPPEPFTVVFDTGSGHLVLPSSYCPSETCRAHKRFRPSKSSTARAINYDGTTVRRGQMRDSLSVSFGTGEVSGVFVEDIVCIDGLGGDGQAEEQALNGETLPPGCLSMRFIAATELSEDPFKEFQFDGILGLGLDGLSQSPEFNFIHMVAQSVGEWGGSMPHTFGVFLADSEKEDSEIALGGWARPHLQEDLSWAPVVDPEMGHWIIPIRGIRVDDERLDFCKEGCKAAVDTGTSLLAVPTKIFPDLWQSLRHPAPLAGHCQGFGPLLHIELDHFTVTLGPRDYAELEPTGLGPPRPRLVEGNKSVNPASLRSRRDLRCAPALMTLDFPEPLGPKLFILGEPVLRKYYTVYDGLAKRVGFGRARHQSAPTRDDLLVMAAEVDVPGGVSNFPSGSVAGNHFRPRRRRPTMFDIFRWRKSIR